MKCVPRLYNTFLLVVGSYQANLRRPNRPINTITRFSPLLTLVWPSTSINFLIPPSKLVTQLFKCLAYRSLFYLITQDSCEAPYFSTSTILMQAKPLKGSRQSLWSSRVLIQLDKLDVSYRSQASIQTFL